MQTEKKRERGRQDKSLMLHVRQRREREVGEETLGKGRRREGGRGVGYRKPQVFAGRRVGGLERGQRECGAGGGVKQQQVTGRLRRKETQTHGLEAPHLST